MRGWGRGTAAALAGCLLLAGCGGSGGGTGESRGARGEAARVLRQAVRATEAAGSARTESVSEIEGELTRSLGALDWSGKPYGRLRVGVGGDLVLKDGEAWVRLARPVAGKRWVRQRTGTDLVPAASLRLLLAAADAHRAGRARVRGVVTTHWAGRVRAAESARVREAGVAAQSVDVWLDARGRLVKRVESGRGKAGLVRVTTYWSGFGTDVEVPRVPGGGN
ncbi:hypothetical protein [Streptomyces sp. AM 3-1-1]|uniref:hypothetical protein n=1 Tax=Streptomyces sp. AM 3-1-1 TaxID=3028711 RepID=UPI0023B8F22F|nr:hypothetical protein [Streptomyces sp. AM 3-1-1]WEH29258.1 hypothetical protein P0D76_19120 [Streptomyces sp. AM 3-1-1]